MPGSVCDGDARDLGADHYLGKPYSEDELLGLVQQYASAEKSIQ